MFKHAIIGLLTFLACNIAISQEDSIPLLMANKAEVKEYCSNLILSDLLMKSSTITNEEYCILLNNFYSILAVDTIVVPYINDFKFVKYSFVDHESINNFYKGLEDSGVFIFRKQYVSNDLDFLFPKKTYFVAIMGSLVYKLDGFRILDYTEFFDDLHYFNAIIGLENDSKKKEVKAILKPINIDEINLWEKYKLYYPFN